MNYFLLQKQDPIFIFTKSLNQYFKIKAQTSDEIQPLEISGNSTVVFDVMLLSKPKSNVDLFFTRRRHNSIDIYYLPKNTIRNISNIKILYKQFLGDNILLFHDIAGLDMSPEEWKRLCRNAWKYDYDYLQIDGFAKIGEGRYTFRNCNKNACVEATSEMEPF